MVSFLYAPNSGVVGDLSRPDETQVEPALLDATTHTPTKFGVPVKMVNSLLQAFSGGETATDFYGVLSRMAPSIAGDIGQVFNTATPNVHSTQGVITRGYAFVKCTIGTPIRDGVVYVRIVAAAGKEIGDFEATADGSNNVALTNTVWAANGVDANLTAEIRIRY